MRFFKNIHEGNKVSLNKPLGSDMLDYAEPNEKYTNNAYRSFSAKLVVDHSIRHKNGGKEYKAKTAHYTPACRQLVVKAYFHTYMPVKSIRIDICPRTLSAAYNLLLSKNEDRDTGAPDYFRYPECYVHIYPPKGSAVSQKLQIVVPLIRSGRIRAFNKEWFPELTEKIIYKEHGNYIALKNIQSIRASTRKEILRRLQLGKDYMDEHFLTIKEIRQAAEYCNMSEYHFFRSFKEAFGVTPFQYLTGKKMTLAKELVQNRERKLSDIALTCNFPDVFTFSKAFKRYYGVPPSAMR